MKLSQKDVQLFYKLMIPLLYYGNQKEKVVKDIVSLEEFREIPLEEFAAVRDIVFQDNGLINAFIKENPQKLNAAELEILETWNFFVADTFVIERTLKKYSVFIGSRNSVYGVLGLSDGFQEIFHKSYFPLYGKTVLLPFKGRIIYDGLLIRSNIRFGGGMKRSMKEVYLAAKQNNAVITSLTDEVPAADPNVPENNTAEQWQPVLEELATAVKKLKSGAQTPPLYKSVVRLLKSSLAAVEAAVHSPGDLNRVGGALEKTESAVEHCFTVLERDWRFRS